MAFSYSEATGDGHTKVFPFSFSGNGKGYIREEDIHVYVDSVEVFGFSLSGVSQIQLLQAPPRSDSPNVMIRRIVPKDVPYADFTRGNNFGQDQLNNSALQQLYALHEFLDGFLPSGHYIKSDLNMKGHRLINLGLPLDGEDATPYSLVEPLAAQIAAINAGLPVDAFTNYTASIKVYDVISKGPWLDARAYTTLAAADAAAVALGRKLLISTVWNTVPAIINSDVKCITGGVLNITDSLTINGATTHLSTTGSGNLHLTGKLKGDPSLLHTGSTSGLSVARPEWFGSAASAFTKAVAALGTGGTIFLLPQFYAHEYITTSYYMPNPRIKIRGSGKPSFNSTFTALEGGSILQGPFYFMGDGTEFHDLGVDSGSTLCAAKYAGVAQDALGTFSVAQTAGLPPKKGLVVSNVSLLGKDATSSVHALLAENVDGAVITNVATVYNTYGVVLKGTNSNITGIYARGHYNAGVIIKSDSYAVTRDNTISNVCIQGIGSYDTGGLNVQAATAAQSRLNVTNLSVTNCRYAVQVVGSSPYLATDINVSNISGYNLSGMGASIYITGEAQRINIAQGTINTIIGIGVFVDTRPVDVSVDSITVINANVGPKPGGGGTVGDAFHNSGPRTLFTNCRAQNVAGYGFFGSSFGASYGLSGSTTLVNTPLVLNATLGDTGFDTGSVLTVDNSYTINYSANLGNPAAGAGAYFDITDSRIKAGTVGTFMNTGDSVGNALIFTCDAVSDGTMRVYYTNPLSTAMSLTTYTGRLVCTITKAS